MITDVEREKVKDFVRNLFFVSETGLLEKFIRESARNGLRLAKQDGGIQGNLYDASAFFKWAAELRELAACALPDGRLLAIPRSEIERMHGPQKWTEE